MEGAPSLRGSIDRGSLRETLYEAFAQYGDRRCIGQRGGSTLDAPFYYLSYAEFGECCDLLGQALAFYGRIENMRVDGLPKDVEVRKDDDVMVGILVKNSAQAYMADMGCCLYNLVSVPLYATLGHESLQYIVRQTNMRVIVVDSSLLPVVVEILSSGHEEQGCRGLPPTSVDTVIVTDLADPALLKLEKPLSRSLTVAQTRSQHLDRLISASTLPGIKVMTIEEAMSFVIQRKDSLGSRAFPPTRPAQQSQLLTLMYTSGSTGRPKGAMITEECWRLRNRYIKGAVPRPPVVWLSFQPPAHLLDRNMVWAMMLHGAVIGCGSNNMQLLFNDFQVWIRESIMMTV